MELLIYLTAGYQIENSTVIREVTRKTFLGGKKVKPTIKVKMCPQPFLVWLSYCRMVANGNQGKAITPHFHL